jgi:hypothetical protein
VSAPEQPWRSGQRHPLTADDERTILAGLRAGKPAYQIAAEVHRSPGLVAKVRDKHGIPPLRVGNPTGTHKPKPEPVDVVGEVETINGHPTMARPRRIPPGMWCIERPNQAQWLALVDAASKVELVALRLAMTWVLGLPLNATDLQIEEALIAEHRTAEELAGLYIQARGYGR